MKMRWIAAFVAVGFLCSLNSDAQAGPPSGPPVGQIDGIAHIAYRVSNLQNELAFLKKLGYEESFAMTHAGKTTEVFVKVNDRQFLEVYPQTNPSQPLGWMHVCFESDDLNALHDMLVSRGLDPSHVVKAGAGNLIFALKDPDGRTTEFTQYMPGSLHTLDRGKHLGADRVSTSLLGFDLPVGNVSAAGTFYSKLGFDVDQTDSGLRVSTSTNPNLRIEVRASHPGAEAETIFLIPDARKALAGLHMQGVDARRVKKLVFTRDPDGNVLVFLEAQSQ
jgi:catechol 2,3-dioxygenase-like lactoylglutathione lyase family enzyme